jgi:2-(1,2-epoxy-1,2-dihydrophenyl)acetyl-CoA isomerase
VTIDDVDARAGSTGHIRYEVDDEGIALMTIDRPDKRNAMTYAVLGDFTSTVARAGDDDRARVLIVTGAGGAFCAGTDLSDLAERPTDERGSVAGAAPPWPLVTCPKPVIAAVDGPAVGMGAEFVTQCDVRIFSTRARVAWNFVHRGLVPDTGAGSWLLPRLVGVSEALRLLYSGEFLDAEAARTLGFAAEVVPPEELLDAARREARRYLAGSPFAIRHTKRLVYDGLERSMADHARVNRDVMAACFASEDHREGVASFLERRPARFVGR